MSSNEVPSPPKLRNIHSHMWLVGTLGIFFGLILMVYVPSLPAVSGSILLFAGFHLIGGLIVLFSAYSLGLRGLLRRLWGRNSLHTMHMQYRVPVEVIVPILIGVLVAAFLFFAAP